MKVIQVIYDDTCKHIIDIVKENKGDSLVDFYNINDYKQRKKASPIMVRYGTENVPLIVFADENLDEYAAIWSEDKPDWKSEINKKLTTW